MEIAVRPRVELSVNRVQAAVELWGPLILVGLAVLVVLSGLGASSLVDWDESIYAQVAREMVQSGDWINLSHGYRPYFEKPPLLMWGIGVFYTLFGVDEFWARLPTALSGILLVYVTYLCGKIVYGHRAGLLSGLILLSSWGFVFQARNGTINMPLSLFIFTGIYGYLRLRSGSGKWWYLILASCALAFMIKFWAGLVLPAVLVIAILLEQKLTETLRSRDFWRGVLLAGAIVLPWLVLAFVQNGQALVDSYITRNLLQRTFTSLEGHSGSTFYYLEAMSRFFSPWYFLVPFAIVVGLRGMAGPQYKNILIVEIILVFGLYTFVVDTKISHYILPIYPALSILVARVFLMANSSSRSYAFSGIIAATLFATIITQDKLLILYPFIGIGLVILIRTELLPKQRLHLIIPSLLFVLFFMVSMIGNVLGNHRLKIRPLYKTQISSVSQIAIAAGESNSSKTDPLIAVAFEEDWDTYQAVEGPSAIFYSNRPVDVATSREQLQELMMKQGSGEILVAEKYLNEMADDYDIVVIEKIDPLVYAKFSR